MNDRPPLTEGQRIALRGICALGKGIVFAACLGLLWLILRDATGTYRRRLCVLLAMQGCFSGVAANDAESFSVIANLRKSLTRDFRVVAGDGIANLNHGGFRAREFILSETKLCVDVSAKLLLTRPIAAIPP